MSIPRLTLRSSVIVFAIAALVVGGCGSNETSSPVNVAPLDEAPPLAPTDLNVSTQYQSKFSLTWTDNAEPDLAGYRVYLYDPDPMRASAFMLVSGDDLVTRSDMTLTGEGGTTYLFRIAAIDLSGNESAWSEPFTFSLHTDPGRERAAAGGIVSEAPNTGPSWQGFIGHSPYRDSAKDPGRK